MTAVAARFRLPFVVALVVVVASCADEPIAAPRASTTTTTTTTTAPVPWASVGDGPTRAVVTPSGVVLAVLRTNADGPRDGPGAETYFQVASPESKQASGLTYEELVDAFEDYDVAWVADRDAGARRLRRRAPQGCTDPLLG